jgi:hypothetical protein
MKFVVIDVETTGLNHLENEILSIGAVVEDTNEKPSFKDIPKFHAAILHREVKGSLFALNMNRDLIAKIVQYESAKSDAEKSYLSDVHGMKFLKKDNVVEEFFYWLYDAGISQNWNFETDGREYLDQIVTIRDGKRYPALTPKMKPLSFTAAGKNFATFDKRFLEELPRWQQCIRTKQRVIDPAILYVDWKNDETLPDLSTCKVRAGLEDTVSHDALADAWDTLQTLRKFY